MLTECKQTQFNLTKSLNYHNLLFLVPLCALCAPCVPHDIQTELNTLIFISS